MKTICPQSSMLLKKRSPVKKNKGIRPTFSAVLISNALTVSKKESRSRLSGITGQGLEDSGYLSLQNSCIDDEADITAKLAAAHQKEPKSRQNPAPLLDQSDINADKLPGLKFMREVTVELAKDFMKNDKYDWSIISKIAKKYPLSHVIGRKIGVEYVDLFSSLLSKNMVFILVKILTMLGDKDLISCSKVSKKWKSIIFLDSTVQNRYDKAEQELGEFRRLPVTRGNRLTRNVCSSKRMLSDLQAQVSPKAKSSSSLFLNKDDQVNTQWPSAVQHSRFREFTQVAECLKQDECLRPCMLCGSPAKCLPKANRAKCTRSSCQFDFCTKCLVAFHEKTPCRIVAPQACVLAKLKSQHLPCSARSKRNIMRL